MSTPDTASSNITWHRAGLTRAERWGLLGVRGATVWFTGLSASGKSTVAAALERALVEQGRFAVWLDGDNLRHGLCRDLGFSEADRHENIRRVAEVARVLAEAGGVAIVSLVSPYAADRAAARRLHETAAGGPIPFYEVHCDASLATCESRDPKGLYRKARAGQITGFTGIDAPYEIPEAPELRLRTGETGIEACVRACVELAAGAGVPAATRGRVGP
jgi:adenylyl-sulfate kinase